MMHYRRGEMRKVTDQKFTRTNLASIRLAGHLSSEFFDAKPLYQ